MFDFLICYLFICRCDHQTGSGNEISCIEVQVAVTELQEYLYDFLHLSLEFLVRAA